MTDKEAFSCDISFGAETRSVGGPVIDMRWRDGVLQMGREAIVYEDGKASRAEIEWSDVRVKNIIDPAKIFPWKPPVGFRMTPVVGEPAYYEWTGEKWLLVTPDTSPQ